jgi:multimeric flavodoxin WrbA
MGAEKYKVLAINGSPRAKKGMTDVIVQRFLKGAQAAGAETEVVYLASLKIAHCHGCLNCWFKTPGICRHKDDMPGLVKKLGTSDLIVFASPVYVDGMTGQMKTMFDRLVTYTPPFFEFEGGRSYHPRVGNRTLDVVVISTCGFPEREHFESIALHFKRICANMHARLLGGFYFPGSSAIASDPAQVEPNLRAVERAGSEMAETGAIKDETFEVANLEYISDPRLFNQEINELFHTMRKHHGSE